MLSDNLKNENGLKSQSESIPFIRNINFFLTAEDHRRIKAHAVAVDKSLQQIMATAINLYLSEKGMPPITLVKAYRK